MDANSSQLWDDVWKHDCSAAEDVCALVREERGIRWQRLEGIVLREFGGFSGLKVVEIGAGAGTNAAIAAKRGAQVTVMDYSEAALERASRFFRHNDVLADFVQQDALTLPQELHDTFDVSMSFGLAEHFRGAARVAIIKAHLDVLRGGGIGFISVPNKYNLPYRIWMSAAIRKGTWMVGEEHPYSRRELALICRQLGIAEYSFFGDSLIKSLSFINPFLQVARLRRRFRSQEAGGVSRIRRQRGTPLDSYLAYALVLCTKK